MYPYEDPYAADDNRDTEYWHRKDCRDPTRTRVESRIIAGSVKKEIIRCLSCGSEAILKLTT
jgi:hypothetical protein